MLWAKPGCGHVGGTGRERAWGQSQTRPNPVTIPGHVSSAVPKGQAREGWTSEQEVAPVEGGAGVGIRPERELQEAGLPSAVWRPCTWRGSARCVPMCSPRHQHPEGRASRGGAAGALLRHLPQAGGAPPRALPTLPAPCPQALSQTLPVRPPRTGCRGNTLTPMPRPPRGARARPHPTSLPTWTYGVAPHRPAHGPRGSGAARQGRQLPVGDHLSEAHGGQQRPQHLSSEGAWEGEAERGRGPAGPSGSEEGAASPSGAAHGHRQGVTPG